MTTPNGVSRLSAAFAGPAGTTPWLSARFLVHMRRIRALANTSGEAEPVSALVAAPPNSRTLALLSCDAQLKPRSTPIFPLGTSSGFGSGACGACRCTACDPFSVLLWLPVSSAPFQTGFPAGTSDCSTRNGLLFGPSDHARNDRAPECLRPVETVDGPVDKQQRKRSLYGDGRWRSTRKPDSN